MNPGGVRGDLDAGPVTYEEAFTAQPFANNLKQGTNAVTGPIDLDAFTVYLGANSPVAAPSLDRITTTP